MRGPDRIGGTGYLTQLVLHEIYVGHEPNERIAKAHQP